MPTGHKAIALKGFRTLFEAGSISGLSDAELLERSSIAGGGPTAELAFAALVERHGPMVLRVCRKSLGDPHDAHDAFQSTFLVLARKAESIRDRRSVASFLHGVALRVSASSRVAIARRRKHERVKAERAASVSSNEMESPDDLGAVLHEEVGRLPGRYRDAVVLCYLEGRSYEEAAGHLRLPVGTIKSRLSWARDRLRSRLTRRGLAPAAGAVATMLAAEAAHAAMTLPSTWVETTVENALKFAAIGPGVVPASVSVLANTVLHAMMMNKIKLAIVAVFGLVTTGAVLTAQQPAPPAASRSEDADRLGRLESKLDRLISAMERQAERSASEETPRATTLNKVYNERMKGRVEPTPEAEPTPKPTVAYYGSVPITQTPARTRVAGDAAIMDRLARLEARMDRLEQQFRAGNPPGQVMQGGAHLPTTIMVAPPAPATPAVPAGLPVPAVAPPAPPATPALPPLPDAPAPPGGTLPPIIRDGEATGEPALSEITAETMPTPSPAPAKP